MADIPPPQSINDYLSYLQTVIQSPKNLHPSSASTPDSIFSSSASDSEDDPPIIESIQDKIKDALDNFENCYQFEGLIQFWAPLEISGRWILTTSDQPFRLLHRYLYNVGKLGFEEYRLCCVKYKYNIDVDKVEVEEDPTSTIISSGIPATAFLNRLPEYFFLKRDDLMTPLESSAFKCGLVCSMVLPVFYPSQSCCVGVIQCSTSLSRHMLLVFNELNSDLEKVGLKTFDAQERLPYKTICGLQNAKDEIDEALYIIWHAHNLPFAQVWIPCEDENQVAFSSSLQDTRTKRMLWLKLTGHTLNCGNFCLEDYGIASDRFPVKMDKDFTGKTLENYEPHFINDILKLNDNKPQRLCHIDIRRSCFVICLKSTKTRDLDYLFEFLWTCDRDNVILFKSLLLTLERCLPSFKLASGAEFGDELRILDVVNSTESEFKYIEFFQRNQLSPVSVTPKTGRGSAVECLMLSNTKGKTTPIPSSHASQAQKRGRQSKVESFTLSNAKDKTKERIFSREEIESEFGKTQKEAAEKLKIGLSTLKRKCRDHGIFEWPGPKYMKTNAKHSHKSQSDTNEEEDNGVAIQEPSANIRETSLGENILTIKVKHVDHGTIKFHLPITTATFGDIEKEINERFNLNPSDYKINYLDEDGDWILLSSDKDMRVCIQNHRNLNTTAINMQVLLRQI